MDKQKRKYLRIIRTKKRTDHLFFLFLFLLFPILIVKKQIGYLSIHSILFLIATIRILSIYSSMLWNHQIPLKKPSSLLDWSVLGCSVIELIRILFKLVDPDQIGAIQFESELMVLLFCILYWIYSEGVQYKEYYLDIFLYAGLLVIAIDLIEKMAGIDLGLRQWSIFVQDGVMLSFLMLFCSVALIRFCYSVDRYKKMTYGALAFLGCLAFFIENSLVGITILAMLFPLLLLKGPYNIGTVKQVLISTFAFFFLLSNMPLMIELLELKHLDGFYKLEYSIYIDLVLSVIGIIVLHYWDKYCENKEESFIFPEIEYIAKCILTFIGIVVLLIVKFILQNGQQLFQNSDQAMIVYSRRVAQELATGSGGIVQILSEQGMMGVAIYGILFTTLLIVLGSHVRNMKADTELWVLSVLGLTATLAFPFSTYLTSLQGMLLLFTLFGKTDEKKIQIKY